MQKVNQLFIFTGIFKAKSEQITRHVLFLFFFFICWQIIKNKVLFLEHEDKTN